MRLLLLAGLSPAFKNESLFVGSLFDTGSVERLARDYYGGFHLGQLVFQHSGQQYPLLRYVRSRGSLSVQLSKDATGKAKPVPHLTSFTLESILTRAETEYESFPLPSVWDGSAEPEGDDFDAVLISTTFIWDRHSLEQAIKWAYARYPKATLILGGQYSNLKYMQISPE